MFRFDLDTEELAVAYGHASAFLFPSGKRLVQSLGLAAGHRVLDVGCGTGLLADYVSRLVGPEGCVVGIDPLPLRVEIAQRRRRPNLTFQTGTVCDLSGFPAAGFDAAYLHLVFHWLEDKVAPLRQLHRVLKPGAALGLTTSAGEQENTLEAARVALLSCAPYDEYAAARGCKSQPVTRAELERLLRETGFSVARLEIEPTVGEWLAGDQAIAFSETITAGNLFGDLPEPLRQRARSDLAAILEARRVRDVIRIEGSRIVTVAFRN